MAPRSTRAERAMAHLPEADPALAALAIWCKIADGAETTQTSHDTIHIGGDFAALPLREQIGVLGHHILHLALRHEGRMASMAQRLGGGFDAATYNMAADGIVNECLVQAGHAIPRPAVTLPALVSKVLGPDTPQSLADWDVDRLYMALTSADGRGKARQQDYAEETAFQRDLQPGLAGDGKEEAAEWQGHLTRALAMSGGAGRGIGAVLGDIADLPRPTTPWEVLLRRLLSNALQEHPRQSHARPRRAWIAAEAEAIRTGGPAPVFEPGFSRDARRPSIVVGLDTSGSITKQMLSMLAAEVIGVARRTGAEVHLLCFDETIHHRAELRAGEDAEAIINAPIRRDGGTAYIDVMAEAAALNPSIIVIMTDLDGAFGPPLQAEVVWATPLTKWDEPPFGRVLSLAR